MRYLVRIIHILSIPLIAHSAWAQPYEQLDPKIVKIISNQAIYRKSIVTSKADTQTLDYNIYGIHPNNCQSALKKLSRYEKFHEYLDLVKLSGYDEKKKMIYLFIDSTLLPFPMSLNFKIDRITKVGTYEFSFDKGFLKGLIGHIYVQETKSGCYFHADSKWSGPSSKIPDTIFEIFSETVGELAMSNLFRVTKSY